MAEHNIIGNIGEEVACEMMRKKGFRIVETNWRFGHLEMDIIAVSRKEIVDPPAYVTLSCGSLIGPPGVALLVVRVEHSESVGKTSFDELVHICALFGKEAGDLGVRLGVG